MPKWKHHGDTYSVEFHLSKTMLKFATYRARNLLNAIVALDDLQGDGFLDLALILFRRGFKLEVALWNFFESHKNFPTFYYSLSRYDYICVNGIIRKIKR